MTLNTDSSDCDSSASWVRKLWFHLNLVMLTHERWNIDILIVYSAGRSTRFPPTNWESNIHALELQMSETLISLSGHRPKKLFKGTACNEIPNNVQRCNVFLSITLRQQVIWVTTTTFCKLNTGLQVSASTDILKKC